jgi:hypothetical protein
MIRSVLAAFLFFGLLMSGASAQSCSVPNTFISGTTASASQVNANFAALLSCVNSPSFTSFSAPQGRLTLAANTPVMTPTSCSGSACSAQTTLRYDCYVGAQVPYYTGTADALDTVTSCEVTDVMVSAGSAGQVVSGQVYDVWWVHGGANRICLAMSSATGAGGGWASDTGGSNTARGTGYTQLDGVTRPYTTNKNSIANCFNGSSNYGSVSANQGTYLGTIYASGNGQISYVLGSGAAGGGAALLGVWNMYNKIDVKTTVTDTTAAWSYGGGLRSVDGSTNNRVSFVSGLPQNGINSSYCDTVNPPNSGAGAALGFAMDNTAAFDKAVYSQTSTTSTISINGCVIYNYNPISGFHYVQALEQSLNGITVAYQGNTFMSLSVGMRM